MNKYLTQLKEEFRQLKQQFELSAIALERVEQQMQLAISYEETNAWMSEADKIEHSDLTDTRSPLEHELGEN